MIEVAIDALPEGYDLVHAHGPAAYVVYDVNPDSMGVWVSVRADDDKIYLFPKRTYRHFDLAQRLGLVS